MWDWLSNWSSNPTSVLAAVAIIALFWHGARWTQRVETGLKTLEERVETGLKTLEERVETGLKTLEERVETGLKTLRDEMRHQQAETRRTLDTLLLRVGGEAQTAASNRPLKLTEFGKRVEANLDPGEWVAATAHDLRPKTMGLEPFEIDALCQEHVRNRLDTEWQRRVARAAYEFGSDTRAVEDVLRIVLRDALLTPPDRRQHAHEYNQRNQGPRRSAPQQEALSAGATGSPSRASCP